MPREQVTNKLSIYGSVKDNQRTKEILNDAPIVKVLLDNFNEGVIRTELQELITNHKIQSAILYNGNTVWDFEKVIRGIKLVKKRGMMRMTNYLYDFLSLACGSIAHYNKFGWIETYPTWEDLRQFFLRNEFGQRVLTY